MQGTFLVLKKQFTAHNLFFPSHHDQAEQALQQIAGSLTKNRFVPHFQLAHLHEAKQRLAKLVKAQGAEYIDIAIMAPSIDITANI
ncbi:hypothetical protein OH492_13470 [Vibrio chagasii]|nr:hypothetical protein [Vibrio chagasii]